ncbi:hypothetical protein LCGC14_1889460 [marine sediment metagenome]|uniref:Uncharacterized protein n=1 Tax=marine sediment metagenome TaxID=412755 RepID=A0A0F9IY35_9ZZZZ
MAGKGHGSLDLGSANLGAQGPPGEGGATNFPDTVPFNNDNSIEEVIDYEEFIYSEDAVASIEEIIKIKGWTVTNDGAVGLSTFAFFNGDLRIECAGAVSNGVAIFRESNQLSNNQDILYKAIIRTDDVGMTDVMYFVGITSGPAAFNLVLATAEADITNGLFFAFSQDDDPNWQVRIKSTTGSQDVTVDTGVAVVFNTVYNFEITYNRATLEVEFFINGVSVHTATMTGNLGSGGVASLFQVIQQAITITPLLQCDALYTKSHRQ